MFKTHLDDLLLNNTKQLMSEEIINILFPYNKSHFTSLLTEQQINDIVNMYNDPNHRYWPKNRLLTKEEIKYLFNLNEDINDHLIQLHHLNKILKENQEEDAQEEGAQEEGAQEEGAQEEGAQEEGAQEEDWEDWEDWEEDTQEDQEDKAQEGQENTQKDIKKSWLNVLEELVLVKEIAKEPESNIDTPIFISNHLYKPFLDFTYQELENIFIDTKQRMQRLGKQSEKSENQIFNNIAKAYGFKEHLEHLDQFKKLYYNWLLKQEQTKQPEYTSLYINPKNGERKYLHPSELNKYPDFKSEQEFKQEEKEEEEEEEFDLTSFSMDEKIKYYTDFIKEFFNNKDNIECTNKNQKLIYEFFNQNIDLNVNIETLTNLQNFYVPIFAAKYEESYNENQSELDNLNYALSYVKKVPRYRQEGPQQTKYNYEPRETSNFVQTYTQNYELNILKYSDVSWFQIINNNGNQIFQFDNKDYFKAMEECVEAHKWPLEKINLQTTESVSVLYHILNKLDKTKLDKKTEQIINNILDNDSIQELKTNQKQLQLINDSTIEIIKNTQLHLNGYYRKFENFFPNLKHPTFKPKWLKHMRKILNDLNNENTMASMYSQISDTDIVRNYEKIINTKIIDKETIRKETTIKIKDIEQKILRNNRLYDEQMKKYDEQMKEYKKLNKEEFKNAAEENLENAEKIKSEINQYNKQIINLKNQIRENSSPASVSKIKSLKSLVDKFNDTIKKHNEKIKPLQKNKKEYETRNDHIKTKVKSNEFIIKLNEKLNLFKYTLKNNKLLTLLAYFYKFDNIEIRDFVQRNVENYPHWEEYAKTKL